MNDFIQFVGEHNIFQFQQQNLLRYILKKNVENEKIYSQFFVKHKDFTY